VIAGLKARLYGRGNRRSEALYGRLNLWPEAGLRSRELRRRVNGPVERR
jgi:hypothetical protein